jgi:hypothetical protein
VGAHDAPILRTEVGDGKSDPLHAPPLSRAGTISSLRDHRARQQRGSCRHFAGDPTHWSFELQ